MVQWFSGSMVPWFNGSLDFHRGKTIGSMVQWFSGSVVQWFNGFTACFETGPVFRNTRLDLVIQPCISCNTFSMPMEGTCTKIRGANQVTSI